MAHSTAPALLPSDYGYKQPVNDVKKSVPKKKKPVAKKPAKQSEPKNKPVTKKPSRKLPWKV